MTTSLLFFRTARRYLQGIGLLVAVSSGLLAQAVAYADDNAAVDRQSTLHGRGSFASSPYGKIYYEREGQGSPVILVAGGPGASHASFHPWFSRLAARHTVVYFDNIGRGRSDRLDPANGAQYTVERDADDIEALRVTLGYEKVAVIGHSYGGMPALAYALKYPTHVSKLILSSTMLNARSWQQNIDSANFTARNQYPEIWQQLLALRADGVLSGAAVYATLYGKTELDIYWRDPDNKSKLFRSSDPGDAWNGAIYRAMLGDDPEWVVGGTMRHYDPAPRMKSMTVPVLVCAGRYDRVGTPAIAHDIKAALPQATSTLRIFERSGHRPWVEETDAYFQALDTFLAD